MYKKRIKTKYNYFNRIRPKDYPYYDWYYDFGDSQTYAWRNNKDFFFTDDEEYEEDYFDYLGILECGCCSCCGCSCDEDDDDEYEFWDVEEEI